ncbi:MAG TPA: 7-cyano-7-deazaguanine synthase, partial [Candidatus Hydrogenedentes bacterium]|nr:7-cyano-7-deazaguanine synthase [Candidatus Hydrogenedentota bacterium]
MEKNTGDAVVLLSGGLDSTVLLHLVRRRLCAGAVHALSFDYGQRHSRELDCAREQAALAGAASHSVLDMSFLGGLLAGGTALVKGGAEVPDLDALSPGMRDQPPTYVPNRNMILLSLAAACAEARGV